MYLQKDQHKAFGNKAKHKVSFETASLIFSDPRHISIQDRHVENEERWQTSGAVDGVVILLVAHAIHERDGEEIIRIISARKADKRERELYEQGIR